MQQAISGSKALSSRAAGAAAQQMPLMQKLVVAGAQSRCHATVCKCYAASSAPSSSGRSAAEAQVVHQLKMQYLSPAAAGVSSADSKYERIVAFVEAHATPIVSVDADSSSSSMGCLGQEDECESSWHHSYDEEAEEGELCDEPHIFSCAAQQYTAIETVNTVTATADTIESAAAAVNSWQYGSQTSPKPWCYSWDEEAEGAYELAATSRPLTLPQLKADKRAALHEARHAGIQHRRSSRRTKLHPQLGDLEHMQAWVASAPETQQQQRQQQQPRRITTPRYQQLLAFVAGDSTSGQYRKPMQWHLTFDEDVHGSEAPDAVLGSC